MSMEFVYKKDDVRKAKISSRSNLQMVNYVFDRLDDHHKDMFKESCFCNFLKLIKTKVAYQIFHQIMIRQVKSDKTNEAWFSFNGKLARFGLQEFTLVTGLNAGELEEETIEEGKKPYLLENYFKRNKGRINRKELLDAFDRYKNQEDKKKLGLLVCLVWVLLGAEERTLLNPWLFHIVEDLKKFNSYPWGKKSFLYTMRNFKRKWESTSKKLELKKRKEYNLQGFPFTVMVWGLEVIPALGERFAESCGERVPRMLSWKVNDQLKSYDIDNFLESRKHKVKCKLEPTEAEKSAVFWEQMAHLEDVEDLQVDLQDVESASKGDSTGDDDSGNNSTHEKGSPDFEERCHDTPCSADYVLQMLDKKLEEFKHSILVEIEHKFEAVNRKIDKLM